MNYRQICIKINIDTNLPFDTVSDRVAITRAIDDAVRGIKIEGEKLVDDMHAVDVKRVCTCCEEENVEDMFGTIEEQNYCKSCSLEKGD